MRDSTPGGRWVAAVVLPAVLACALAAVDQERPAPSQTAKAQTPTELRTVTILPQLDTYVDKGAPTTSHDGKPLIVSSSKGNEPQKIAYAIFDLSLIPRSSTIKTSRLFFTVEGPAKTQVVRVALTGTWPNGPITWKNRPGSTATRVGTWRVLGSTAGSRVATDIDNPALVKAVGEHLTSDGKLEIEIISDFGVGGAPTSNTYDSFASTDKSGRYGAGPRLVVQYEPHPRPLRRDWRQHRADARQTGRSPWRLAGPPTAEYKAETMTRQQSTSEPVIFDGMLYLFAQGELRRVDPADGVWHPVVWGLPAFSSLALTPDGKLWAAGASELAAFDLTPPSPTQIASFSLIGASPITAGSDGSVYLTQNGKLVAVSWRNKTLQPLWDRELESSSESSMISPATLNADGSIVYIATDKVLYALDSADGSLRFSHALLADKTPEKCAVAATPKHLTTPVASLDGRVYFGVDARLFVFADGPVPNCFDGDDPVGQPVIDPADTLYVPQGPAFYTVGADGNRTKAVLVPGITATDPLVPTMDGDGNLYVIDSAEKLFVLGPDFGIVNRPQDLSSFGNGLRPGVQLAPNGSLFASSPSALFRLRPEVVVDPVTVPSYADRTAYRAAGTLVLEGAAVPQGASVVFQSGGDVKMRPGFTVPVGASVVVNTGY